VFVDFLDSFCSKYFYLWQVYSELRSRCTQKQIQTSCKADIKIVRSTWKLKWLDIFPEILQDQLSWQSLPAVLEFRAFRGTNGAIDSSILRDSTVLNILYRVGGTC
jgi:hypothetical protein